MAEVSIDVAGRAYRLGCGDGEEPHLQELGAFLDAEAKALMRQFGQMPEGRLMLMTALMIADRLQETEQRLAKSEKLAESRAQPADMFGPEREERIVRHINELAARIEGAARDD